MISRACSLPLGAFLLLAGVVVSAQDVPATVQLGARAFGTSCSYCHNATGPGTAMLARRLGSNFALLESRDDLTPEYVRMVVRNGLNGMPALRKVELSDADMDAIAAYLNQER